MPALSVRYGAELEPGLALFKEGPKVPVELHIPRQLERFLRDRGEHVPGPVSGQGLIDTGASISMVDEAALASLGVSPVGVAMLGTAGGASLCTLFPVRLAIVLPPNPPVWVTEFASIAAGPLQQQSGLLCLLGRDVLRHARLVYDGGIGEVSLTF